jgi:hypothetical protein
MDTVFLEIADARYDSHFGFPLSFGQMAFPKFNSVFYPPFGIGTHTKPKAMTCISVPAVFDFYSRVS